MGISRRDFITTGVCTGFALATLPATAWAVSTPSDELVEGKINIPTPDGKMPGYRAMPKGKGPFPTVLVVHEIFGVHEYIQDVCRRLAKEGFLAISPYLYFRQGDVTRLKTINEIRTKVLSKVEMPQVLADLDSTVKWAESTGSADPARLGITGFCWGGTAVWMYAAHQPKLKAGVAWYGRLAIGPLDVVQSLKAPVLGLYGGRDRGIPLSDIEEMRSRLKKAHGKSKIIIYPDAEHGFHADYRPSYNEKAAKDGWQKLLSWFRKNGLS